MAIETRKLARLTTAVENREPAALSLLDSLPPGHARIVGITGPPGAGKSTLVDALAAAIRRRGQTLAILAVDPTSELTGGAILGDRIRMQQHHADPGIFIRSMATRGNPGGIARATADVARLMSASGKDYVLIETVGVGQAEIEIASLAEVTVVVLVPGMGDDVQAIKAGIMEIAGIFVINKSDHPGAGRVEHELRAELDHPTVLRTVATTGEGVDALLDAIAAFTPASKPTPRPPVEIEVLNLADAVARLRAAGVPIRETPGRVTIHVAGVPLELTDQSRDREGAVRSGHHNPSQEHKR